MLNACFIIPYSLHFSILRTYLYLNLILKTSLKLGEINKKPYHLLNIYFSSSLYNDNHHIILFQKIIRTMTTSSILWPNPPSLTLCIVALVLFGLSALIQSYQTIKYRQKFFIFFVLGAFFQVVGYTGRIGCVYDLNSIDFYVVQSLFVLLAPIFYAVSIYSLLGKIVQFVGAEDKSPVKPTRITCIFVIGDIVSFIMQSTGGGMMVQGGENAQTGSEIILIGLIIQLVFFFIFIFLTILFHIRANKLKELNESKGNWKMLLKILEVSCMLILIRSVYRVVEYAQGFDGYLITHEVYQYSLDALMMLLVQLLYNCAHPGKVFYAKEEKLEKFVLK